MMGEFDRRLIEVAANHVDLTDMARALGAGGQFEHFSYVLRIGTEDDPLLDGVEQSGYLAMQSDAWFVMQYVSSCVIRPDSPQWFTDSGSVQLRVTDTGESDSLYSSPTSAGVLTATISRPQTGIPLLLPIPRIVPPNTNLKVDVTQLGVNVTDNQEPIGFWLFFGGSRIAVV